MTCPTRLALAATLALGLAAPALGQTQGTSPGTPQTQGGPAGMTSRQGGPHGSAAGPIGPQLQAVQSSLSNAEQQISASRSGSQPPNWEQTRRTLQGAEDTLNEMRGAGGDTRAVQDALREVGAARRLVDGGDPDPARVANQLRTALNAVTAINSGATGPSTNPGPGVGGGARP